jgi:hypothetical protein
VRISRSKLGAALAGGYLVLIAAVVIWASVLVQASPAYSGEPSSLAFFLTFPWSLLAAVVLSIVNTGLLESYLTTLVVVVVSAAINAAILYLLGATLGRLFSGTGGRT